LALEWPEKARGPEGPWNPRFGGPAQGTQDGFYGHLLGPRQEKVGRNQPAEDCKYYHNICKVIEDSHEATSKTAPDCPLRRDVIPSDRGTVGAPGNFFRPPRGLVGVSLRVSAVRGVCVILTAVKDLFVLLCYL
jgi:hypothetical protein